MNIVRTLNLLHRKRYYRFLSLLSSLMYFLKGNGIALVRYLKQYRAYEVRINNVSYLTPGPGWAYSNYYLKNLLQDTYCYFYLPRQGDVVVDIGAGLGEETVVLGQLIGPTGKLLAVEANPITMQALEYACAQNKFEWINVINVALYDKDGEVSIEDNMESYVGNTINSNSGISTFKVRALTLDSMIKENGLAKIDFLKLNIEGAEQFLIEGSQDTIHLVSNACISCHDFRHNYHQHGEFYVTRERIVNFFKSNGFEIMTRNTGNVVVDDFVYAKRV